MAAHKRNHARREADLERVSELYCAGWTQVKMAEQIGVSRQQIKYDLNELEKRWLDRSMKNIDDAKAVELARIDNLERVYWHAWEQSIGERHKTITKGSRAGAAEGQPPPAVQRVETTRATEEMNGDPRYLEGVRWCIAKRCELLGLNAPAKIAPTDPQGKNPYLGGGLSGLLESKRGDGSRS